MKIAKPFFHLLAAAVMVCAAAPGGSGKDLAGPAAASAQADWKQEFEDICAKTQDAMTLNSDDLKKLVSRCDALKPVIDRLGETERKVYLKRLQMCRDLYLFVLESKKQ